MSQDVAFRHSLQSAVHHGTTGSDEHIETRSQLEFDLHQPGAVGVTTCGAVVHTTTIKTTTTTATTTITKTCQPGKRSHDVVRQTAIFHYKWKTSTSNRVQKQPLTWCSESGVKARLAFQGLNPFQKNLYKIPKMPWFIHVYIYIFIHTISSFWGHWVFHFETDGNVLQCGLQLPAVLEMSSALEVWPSREVSCCSAKDMGLSENSVPLHPMVLLIIIPTKWL